MKKTAILLLCLVTVVPMLVSCGRTQYIPVSDTGDDTSAAVVDTSTVETTTAERIDDADIVLLNVVKVSPTNDWYATNTEPSSLVLKNDTIDGVMPQVTVEVCQYNDDVTNIEDAAQAMNNQYKGVGNTETETINGISYIHLSNLITDDSHNIFFAEIDDTNYLVVSVLYMPLDDGIGALDMVSIINN